MLWDKCGGIFSDLIKVLNHLLWVDHKGDYSGWAWPNEVSLLKEVGASIKRDIQSERLPCWACRSKLPYWGKPRDRITWQELQGPLGRNGRQAPPDRQQKKGIHFYHLKEQNSANNQVISKGISKPQWDLSPGQCLDCSLVGPSAEDLAYLCLESWPTEIVS